MSILTICYLLLFKFIFQTILARSSEMSSLLERFFLDIRYTNQDLQKLAGHFSQSANIYFF